jgi:ribosomal protein S18 acetylase RimI-like enzyme
MNSSSSYDIFQVTDEGDKSSACEIVLRQLPSWFGIEKAIVEYVEQVKKHLFFAIGKGGSLSADNLKGFIAIRSHYQYSGEVYVMGVIPSDHRSGFGKELLVAAENACRERGIRFLTVKTLSPSRESSDYGKTRKFYEAMGFEPLEEFKTLWGEANPCLYMIKVL